MHVLILQWPFEKLVKKFILAYWNMAYNDLNLVIYWWYWICLYIYEICGDQFLGSFLLKKIICRVLRNVAFSVVTRPVWIWDMTFSSFPQNQNHNLKRNNKSNIKYRSKNPIIKKQEIVKRRRERTFWSMWGKMALRCWIEWTEEGEGKEEWLGLGGEKRTGEEEEQRILLDTGGFAARLRLSSNMDDLFPHTMADMFRCSSALCVSLQPLPPPLLSLLSLPHLLFHAPFSFPDSPEIRSQIPPENEIYQSNLTAQAGSESEQIKDVEGLIVLVHGTVEGGVIGWRRGPGKDQSRGDMKADFC